MAEEAEIKSYIQQYYSEGDSWREGFADTKGMSFTSRIINYLKKSEFKLVFQLLKKYPYTGTFVDAGCGNGLYSLELAREYPAASIQAVDFSPLMCTIVRKKAAAAGVRNITVVQGDIDHLPFPENSVNVLLCIDALHHVPDSAIMKTLAELQRVLKHGGLLLIDFKNRYNLYVYYSHKKRNRVTYYRVNRTLPQVKKQLRRAGFSFLKAKGVGFPGTVLAPYVVVAAKKL
ncbi:class I SAM-dependent methyltransferase [Candidatus Woesearchaeota archaeon]|nr:class I SAM-dependent methyltransferase [Candidatus Woesearchaeota archaeon]